MAKNKLVDSLLTGSVFDSDLQTDAVEQFETSLTLRDLLKHAIGTQPLTAEQQEEAKRLSKILRFV